MTDQEFFNKVWERAKDPRVASGTGGTCMYRAPDGLRCFVGECIPDAEYDPSIEKNTVSDLLFDGKIPPTLNGVDVFLMSDCQSVHDCHLPQFWRERLTFIAEKYKLQIPN